MTASQRRVIPLVFTITLTGIMGNTLLSPAIPDVLDEFGKDDSATGLLVAATSVAGIVVAPVVGLLADRWGRRNVLTPCLAIFGVAGLAAATAPTFGILIAARFAMGFGSAGMINLAVVLIGDHFVGEDRTRMIGRNAAVLTVGLATMPLAAGIITDLAGWRWALAPYGLGLVTAALAWFQLDGEVVRDRSTTLRTQLGGLGAALEDRTIRFTLVAGVLSFAIIFGTFLAILPNHLEAEFGLSARWRGAIISVPAITSSIVGFNLARLRGIMTLRAMLIASVVAWSFAFVLIGGAPVLWVLIVGCLLYGFGEGALIPNLQNIAIDLAPTEHRGGVVAVWVGFARLGQTAGPLLAGLVLAVSTTGVGLLLGAALSLVLVAVIAMAPFSASPASTPS